jgi:hypothetical protein
MDIIPTSKQTLNLFREKLREIELQADKIETAEATAFVAHEKENSNSTKVNSSKCKKRGAYRAKQKFPYNVSKQLSSLAC